MYQVCKDILTHPALNTILLLFYIIGRLVSEC